MCSCSSPGGQSPPSASRERTHRGCATATLWAIPSAVGRIAWFVAFAVHLWCWVALETDGGLGMTRVLTAHAVEAGARVSLDFPVPEEG